jgi:hypothetical protein
MRSYVSPRRLPRRAGCRSAKCDGPKISVQPSLGPSPPIYRLCTPHSHALLRQPGPAGPGARAGGFVIDAEPPRPRRAPTTRTSACPSAGVCASGLGPCVATERASPCFGHGAQSPRSCKPPSNPTATRARVSSTKLRPRPAPLAPRSACSHGERAAPTYGGARRRACASRRPPRATRKAGGRTRQSPGWAGRQALNAWALLHATLPSMADG